MARFAWQSLVAMLALGVAESSHAQFWRRSAETEPESVTVVQPPAAAIPIQNAAQQPQSAPLVEPSPQANSLPAQTAAHMAPVVTGDARGELIEKRAMYRLRDQETVDALVRLAAGRQLREQELVVVSRLIREKEMELAAFDERLQQQFGVSETGNYHYDNERRVLFEITPRAGVSAEDVDPSDPLAAFDKTPMRRLKDEETEQHFLRLVGAKKITTDQIRALQLIVQEKRIELSNILDSLREQFSMDADRHYEYDAETRVVYELIYEAPTDVQSASAAP